MGDLRHIAQHVWRARTLLCAGAGGVCTGLHGTRWRAGAPVRHLPVLSGAGPARTPHAQRGAANRGEGKKKISFHTVRQKFSGYESLVFEKLLLHYRHKGVFKPNEWTVILPPLESILVLTFFESECHTVVRNRMLSMFLLVWLKCTFVSGKRHLCSDWCFFICLYEMNNV